MPLAYDYPDGGYVKDFDASQIPGSTQAKLIDDTFRNMHSALIERLDDTLFDDTTTDPLVLKPEISGRRIIGEKYNSKRLPLPHSGIINAGGGSVTITTQYISASGDNGPLILPVTLPPGVTVLEVALYAQVVNISGGPGTATFQFYYIDSSTLAFSVAPLITWTTTSTANAVVPGYPTGTITIADFYNYAIAIEVTPSDAFHHIKIYGGYLIYDTESHLYTL